MSATSDIRIGVMSVRHEGRPPFGKQTYFFEDMVCSIPTLKKHIFFFSPLDIQINKVNTMGYQFIDGKWIEMESEIPDIIYDRSFSSNETQKRKIEKVRQRFSGEKKIILNPLGLAEVLNDKVVFHDLLMDHNIATLDTLPFDRLKTRNFMLQLFTSRFYVKPTFGSKGQGIFVIEAEDDVYNLIDNVGNAIRYQSYDDLVVALERQIAEEDRYFLQREAKTVHYNGAPFDIRVLVQNYGDDYQVTGKAVRIGQVNAVTSNLNAGGIAIPFEVMSDFFEKEYGFEGEQLNQDIDALCLQCASTLKQAYGDFCEIGFDVLITSDFGPIIIEGNAKPSRWVFVKIADYLAEKGEDNTYFLNRRKETVSVPMKYASYLLNLK